MILFGLTVNQVTIGENIELNSHSIGLCSSIMTLSFTRIANLTTLEQFIFFTMVLDVNNSEVIKEKMNNVFG